LETVDVRRMASVMFDRWAGFQAPRRHRFHGAGRQRFRRPIEFLPHNNRMLDATKIPFPGDLDQAGYVIFSVNAIFG